MSAQLSPFAEALHAAKDWQQTERPRLTCKICGEPWNRGPELLCDSCSERISATCPDVADEFPKDRA